MRRSLPTLVLYAPAIALFVAGIVVLTTTPLTTTPSCSCSTGPNGTTVCPTCAPGTRVNLLGPLLLLASGLYAFGAFLARLSQRVKSAPELPHGGNA